MATNRGAQALEQIRLALGLGVNEMASNAGVDAGGLSRILRGLATPGRTVSLLLRDAYHVDPGAYDEPPVIASQEEGQDHE